MKIDVIGKRKYWYILSAALIIVGIASLLSQGLNFGIDFSGGSLLHVDFQDSNVEVERVREVLGSYELGGSSIQKAGDGSIIIRMPEVEQDQLEEVYQGFTEEIGEFDLLRSEKVGPVIGNELRKAALLALAIAAVLQIIYITIRFEFKFGIAAILALLHDVFITVMVFSIMQYEVTSTFVAAVLTIIGYSINDTIVIFDRIRENLKNRRKEPLSEIINNSVNQTLVRSINTTLAVVFILVALIFFGGETIKDFAVAMLIGVISGAYSSIFVASTLWYEFKPEEHKELKRA